MYSDHKEFDRNPNPTSTLIFCRNKFQKIFNYIPLAVKCLKMALSAGWISVLEYLVIFHPRVMYRDHRN